jgi:hypothetical protein
MQVIRSFYARFVKVQVLKDTFFTSKDYLKMGSDKIDRTIRVP